MATPWRNVRCPRAASRSAALRRARLTPTSSRVAPLDRRERLACVEERVEAIGVVAEPNGGELHVARPLDRLRARPDVADGEACDPVAVAHEDDVTDALLRHCVELPSQVEPGIDRVGELAAGLERRGFPSAEGAVCLDRPGRRRDRLLGQRRQRSGPEAVLPVQVDVLRARGQRVEAGAPSRPSSRGAVRRPPRAVTRRRGPTCPGGRSAARTRQSFPSTSRTPSRRACRRRSP